jgi:hypothetical protein
VRLPWRDPPRTVKPLVGRRFGSAVDQQAAGTGDQ